MHKTKFRKNKVGLETSWGALGASWSALGGYRGDLGGSWGLLGASRAVLEATKTSQKYNPPKDTFSEPTWGGAD